MSGNNLLSPTNHTEKNNEVSKTEEPADKKPIGLTGLTPKAGGNENQAQIISNFQNTKIYPMKYLTKYLIKCFSTGSRSYYIGTLSIRESSAGEKSI